MAGNAANPTSVVSLLIEFHVSTVIFNTLLSADPVAYVLRWVVRKRETLKKPTRPYGKNERKGPSLKRRGKERVERRGWGGAGEGRRKKRAQTSGTFW